MKTQDVDLQTKGPQLPFSADNPDGYTTDERARRQPPKERESARGRKNQDGIEAVPDYRSVREKSIDAMKLFRKLVSAEIVYNESVKAIAKAANINASSLNRLIKASYKGDFEDVKRKVEQQSDLFGQVGEIPGGKGQD